MTVVVACHQPNFMPWLGYFAKIARCDTFVVLDDVQFTQGNNKHNWTSRVRILGSNGPLWVSMPIVRSGAGPQKICDLRTDEGNPRWLTKMVRTFREAYSSAPYFEEAAPLLEILSAHRASVMETNVALINRIVELLGLPSRFVFSSQFLLESSSTQRLIDLVKACGGRTYLSGDGAMGYEDVELFSGAGIELRKLGFTSPAYRQRSKSEFIPGLSIFDSLCFAGVAATSDFVKSPRAAQLANQ